MEWASQIIGFSAHSVERAGEAGNIYYVRMKCGKFSSWQEALQGFLLLPKWKHRELTVRWLMWLVYSRGNSICVHTGPLAVAL